MGQVTDNPGRSDINKQHRKLQNRRNQRARRQRLKGKDAESDHDAIPFEVRRWRVDEVDSSSQDTNTNIVTMGMTHPPCFTVPATAEQATGFSISQPIVHLGQVVTTGSATQSFDFAFPLSSDHLLHLIQYNVFRALISIKRTLNTVSYDPTTCPVFGPCLDDTMSYPPNPNLPPSLAPTTLQLTRYHFPWINIIPFPRVRDNLIRREGRFDNWELLQDLVGNLMSSAKAPLQRDTPVRTSSPVLGLEQPQILLSGRYVDTDEVTTGRNGLIIWGEPHDMQSWEATPGFLAKWSWAVEGCDGLVESSNRWRVRRGEEPIRVAI
ncbi:hypothetical protein KAF25_009214 [Fusarium avenaceum]|uniref:BZIP domain-containing protein n=1 Tax=Fusarium avenaceum TaxID=40199 RepID=A0A9P7GXV7_9HYPO|nr:hypothetical protein KAF25_009214 [Fusarium avenaceum]